MFQWIKNIFKGAGSEIWEITKHATGEAIGKGISGAGEAAVKIAVEKIIADPHGELLTDIKKFLSEEDRQAMFRRLLRHTAEHRENRTANLLLKIPREQRREVFEWLCWLDDQQFEQVLDLLENNKIEEFLARNWAKIKIIAGELVKNPAIKNVWAELDNRAQNITNQLQPTRDRLRAEAQERGWRTWFQF